MVGIQQQAVTDIFEHMATVGGWVSGVWWGEEIEAVRTRCWSPLVVSEWTKLRRCFLHPTHPPTHPPTQASPNLAVFVSYFEIYGGRCQDLLNDRHKLLVREDGKGDVVIG